jgi:probable addiction module antidote protein
MTIPKGKRKTGAKVPASVPHKPHLLNWLKDARNAAAYLEAAFEEDDVEGLMQAVRNVAEAQGGIARVAERTGLSRETLYRTLSKQGNPQVKSLAAILGATGLRLAVKPVEPRARKAA